MGQPVDKRAPLKFKFLVPAFVEIEYRGADKAEAVESLAKALKRGEGFLFVNSVRDFEWNLLNPDKWPAQIQWKCPDCSREYWFDLSKRNCYGTCFTCNKKFVVIEAFAFWNTHKKCDACPRRLECMLIPRLDPENAIDR